MTTESHIRLLSVRFSRRAILILIICYTIIKFNRKWLTFDYKIKTVDNETGQGTERRGRRFERDVEIARPLITNTYNFLTNNKSNNFDC